MSSQSDQCTATLPQSRSLDGEAGLDPATANAADMTQFEAGQEGDGAASVPLPAYLQQTYWWAYLHPAAVRFFERQWLVNLILWGNFSRLRDLALDEIGDSITGDVLQIACVYGNFTERLIQRLKPTGRLDVVDVAQVQLENLKAKLTDPLRIGLHHQDSTDLRFADASYDCVILFFLLHEQPENVRAQTVTQALRVVKPGGKVIFVDYHRPSWLNPFRYVMTAILKTLEPFAMDLWRQEITDWLPDQGRTLKVEKETFFGGLYQKVVVARP
ncbi:MAG: rhodoquinone biosynthesis methyltransferase RquA [Candidatus Contendobacter sp.]|nr:rhodoquinone biosynthesis methyltransferase RquA [Candidatus Contendobacter sp.]